jgi:hypothetical protein
VLILVVLFLVFRGGGSSSPATATPPAATPATNAARHQAASAPAANPATLQVAVINGTNVNELAHHLAGDLTQNGYNQATPLDVHLPATAATTTVYYADGRRADARGVAQVLGVTSVAPMTTAVRSQSGSAPVVVVAGTDQSAVVGGGTTGGSGTGSGG